MSQGSTSNTLELPAARQVMPTCVGMAGNVARTSSTPEEKIMFVIWYMHENDEQQTSLEILGRERAQFMWDSLHESGYMLLSTRP